MNSAAVQTVLYRSAGVGIGTLGLIFVAPGHTAQFLQNLAYFEVVTAVLCVLFKDKL